MNLSMILQIPKKLINVLQNVWNSTLGFLQKIHLRKRPDKISAMLDQYGLALAYSHFFFCKNILFNRLKPRKEKFEDQHQKNVAYNEVLFFIPKSCEYSIDSSSLDNHLKMEPVIESVAGTFERAYDTTVLRKKFAEDEYFIMDSPSCLVSIKRIKDISDEIASRLTPEVMDKIRNDFLKTLNYLLANQEGCCGRYKFIPYQDVGENPESPADILQKLWYNEIKFQDINSIDQPVIHYNYLGDSLAYLFYSNYLQRLLPELERRMIEWEIQNGVPLIRKLVILCPISCFTLDKLDDSSHSDTSIEASGELPHFEQQVSNNKARKYKTCVYKITRRSQQSQTMYKKKQTSNSCWICTEYAAPVKQMYNMMTCFSNVFVKHKMLEQRKSFSKTLKLLLENDEYGHLCEVLEYEDDKGCRNVSEVLEHFLFTRDLFINSSQPF